MLFPAWYKNYWNNYKKPRFSAGFLNAFVTEVLELISYGQCKHITASAGVAHRAVPKLRVGITR